MGKLLAETETLEVAPTQWTHGEEAEVAQAFAFASMTNTGGLPVLSVAQDDPCPFAPLEFHGKSLTPPLAGKGAV